MPKPNPPRHLSTLPKTQGVQSLTPARGIIAELVRRYSVLGLDCTNLEIQKLAWFLQREIINQHLQNILKLRYAAHKYGPYADSLRHLLTGLDGSYLHCEKRLSDASPFDLIWFEDSKRGDVEAYLQNEDCRPYTNALESTARVIDGFESPLGMELLATVDWIVSEMHYEPNLAAVRDGLKKWPGGQSAARRKIKLFDDRLLTLALERLTESGLAAKIGE